MYAVQGLMRLWPQDCVRQHEFMPNHKKHSINDEKDYCSGGHEYRYGECDWRRDWLPCHSSWR